MTRSPRKSCLPILSWSITVISNFSCDPPGKVNTALGGLSSLQSHTGLSVFFFTTDFHLCFPTQTSQYGSLNPFRSAATRSAIWYNSTVTNTLSLQPLTSFATLIYPCLLLLFWLQIQKNCCVRVNFPPSFF